jgi:hypothetical protein
MHMLKFMHCCIIGHFVDGAQIHKTKASTFIPTFITILSLPAPLRGVVGKGTFLVGLDTTSAEKEEAIRTFLYRDCLIPELQKLNEGINVTISGAGGAIKPIFLQARLILHSLDTKAMEKLLCVQASGSKAGCPLCK